MERQRLGKTLDKELHQKLKLKAVQLNTDAGKIIDCLLEKYLDIITIDDIKDKDTVNK